MGYPDDGGRERRATDGLDWRRAAPPGEPSPAGETPPAAPGPGPGASARPGLGLIAGVALVAAVVGGAVSGGAVALLVGGDDDGETAVSSGATPAAGGSVTVEQTTAIADAASKARPSVIKIQSTRQTGNVVEQEVGSGVVLDREGHILTNAHVVLGTETLKVFLADGTERPAILVGHDFPFTDLAVLQVGPVGISPLEVGDSGALQLGETVIAIGNPLSDFEGTVTVGVVSGLNRLRHFDGVNQEDLIQTDAAVNSGNSGGALINLQGQFIGMPTAVLRESNGGASVEGIAFALPSGRVLEIARGIIEAGGNYPRPTLGLDHIDISESTPGRARLAVTQGALVTQVTAGGAAEAAGIVPGDIIMAVGELDIDESRPLLNGLLPHVPGDTVKVVLNRNGRIIEAQVRLGARS
ncbi:MAG: trypsin-like peptidase domain-containing protein [Dehalococcoidia bacterium]|nr:trypsin-like peptidase domain-containing protein [Dehalococcoidia bacterium]